MVRERLPTSSLQQVRAASTLLLGISRLPLATPGIQVSVDFHYSVQGGNFSWADFSLSDTELCLGTGEHHYDPGVGGDNESQIIFEAQLGEVTEGSVAGWIRLMMHLVRMDCEILINDESEPQKLPW